MTTKIYKLAFIGFGNVGQGLAQIIRDLDFAASYGVKFQIVAICDLLKGSIYNPDGLDAAQLLEAVTLHGNVNSMAAPHRDWDAIRTITETNADVIVEMSYTDLRTGEPAITHIRTALAHNKHAIMTNKGPIALAYAELKALADKHGVELGVEGTVMSGTPSMRLGTELLSAAKITKIQGIVNGTTNYILTRMEAGDSYAAALAEAQLRGYAEADPTGDVEGHDAVGKVVILANLLMGASLKIEEVDRTGITQLTSQDIEEARAAGQRWKLIGSVEHTPSGVRASVRPTRIPIDHPLAGVGGATNAITYTTQLLGDVTLVGPGAGRIETGYALIGDLLAIHRKYQR